MVLAATDCQLAGRYRLCRWLAAGGMGQVWQAVDEVLGRPVAVKLLRDEYAQDPAFVRRLRAEARYAAAVTHPGIASVFDYGEVRTTDGAEPTAFVVMELVEGEPLSWLLAREGRLELDRSLDVVGQAAVAVGRPTGSGWSTATSSQPTCWMALDHPLDHPDDPTGPVSIRPDRRPIRRGQARSVWSGPERRGAPGYGSGGWGLDPSRRAKTAAERDSKRSPATPFEDCQSLSAG
jgi:hypothetical protein